MNYFISLVCLLFFFGCSKTPSTAPVFEEDPTTVTLVVEMSYQIEQGNFNADTDIVSVVGSFTDWENAIILDLTENAKYSATITTLQSGDEILFKFRIGDDEWEQPNPDITECVDDGFGSYNRKYIVEDGDNSPLYWFSDDDGSNSRE